jgi:hypothetical protein
MGVELQRVADIFRAEVSSAPLQWEYKATAIHLSPTPWFLIIQLA